MADSEMIAGLLRNAGYQPAVNPEDSSVNIIVTCSVKDATEHRMLHRIKSLSKDGKPLVIAGCLPKADTLKVELLTPNASLLGPNSIDQTVGLVNASLSGQRLIALVDSTSDKIGIPKIRLNPAISIVEIASGCMSECTFCQTKLAKGSLKSYRTGDIVRQVTADVEEGCKEVWLSSTDNGCYGMDSGTDLVQLLKACCEIEGDFKLRIGMLNPMYLPSILDRLVEVIRNNDKIYKFLHIPVQSGSDSVLRKMKRGHTVDIFRRAARRFRDAMPEMSIATDVIVGFPTETEADFRKTLALLKETEPDVINSSRYSPRPGTQASELKHLRSEIVKDRTRRLHCLIKDIMRRRNSLWKDWCGEITVDEIVAGRLVQGRNYSYKSVVLPANDPDTLCVQLGSKLSVQISDFSNFSLKGISMQGKKKEAQFN